MLPKWPFWVHLFYSVLYGVSELRRACFRQEHVAQARASARRKIPHVPTHNISGFPKLGNPKTARMGGSWVS